MAAHEEAKSARHAEVRPEHLILGLLSEREAIVAKVLAAQGAGAEAVRAAATAALPAPVEQPPEPVPCVHSARKALDITFREALRLGHDYIGTEHMLLALPELENGEGVLAVLGVDKARAEAGTTTAIAEVVARLKED